MMRSRPRRLAVPAIYQPFSTFFWTDRRTFAILTAPERTLAEGRKLWPIIQRVWITLGLTATAIFVTWSLVAYRANPEARRAAVSDSTVTVRYADGVWRFEGGSPQKNPTLVFFPGSLVDPRAYAPLARAVAGEGYRVVVVELPRRGAFGGAESPELLMRLDSVLTSLGDSGGFVLAGHSRGAVVASTAAARQPSSLTGLVLIGTTHPRDVDLSGLRVPVTKIVGTRDGLARPADVRQNARLLPPHARWVVAHAGLLKPAGFDLIT